MNRSVLPIQLGRYALYDEIAGGGMARVHIGRLVASVGFSRTVAIKRMDPRFTADPDFVAMFIDEARLAARIHHPNVVQTLDVIATEGELLLVMEYVHGVTVKQLAERGPIPPPIVASVIVGALHGMHAAHEAHDELGRPLGLVHRDLSPHNVMVGVDGVARVLDFGIAKAEGRSHVTASRQVKGKVSYMAPEQVRSEPLDRRTDVFAAGVVLWESLVGRRLFARGRDPETIYAVLQEPVVPPSRFVGGISPALDAITLRALERAPDSRFRTARDMAIALGHAMAPASAVDVGRYVQDVGAKRLADRASRLERIERLSVSTAEPDAPKHLAKGSYSGSTPPPPQVEVTRRVPPPPGQIATLAMSGRPPASSGATGILIAGLVFALVLAGAVAAWLVVAPGRPHILAAPSSSSVAAPSSSAMATVVHTCPPGMASIEGGDFFMGLDSDVALPFEKPQHPVSLSPFCIDLTEVTVEAYQACSDAGRCPRAPKAVSWPNVTTHQEKIYSPLCNIEKAGREMHPINCVDWEMATNYCVRQSKRLPTSAEWEFAARGPDGRVYPWGDDPPGADRLNACGKECLRWGRENGETGLSAMYTDDDGYPNTAPVGSFPRGRSRYGLDDVIGNVMEWVMDWNGPYTKDAQKDPTGPETGTERVIRGGAWNAGDKGWVRPSFRFQFDPTVRSHGVGFRCASARP